MSNTASTSPNPWIIRGGWVLVGLWLLVLVIFAVVRSLDMSGTAENADAFEIRYFRHPVVAAMHMFFSMTFILLAPLQFIARIRNKHRRLHRNLGRGLVICALISGLYGIASLFVLPAYGGLASTTAGALFGPVFLICVCLGFINARQRQFVAHREWMIRTFALGLGVGTQRLFVGIFSMNGVPFEAAFGPALWLGFSINLIVAEIWIQSTR